MARQFHRWRFISWAVAVPVLCSLLAVPALLAQSTVEDLYAITFDKKLLWVNPGSGQCLLVATLNVDGNPYGMASAKQGHGESGGLWVVTTSNRLYQVEHDTGRLLATNLLSLPPASGGALAWGPIFNPGIFVAQTLNGTGVLHRVNPAAGTSVVVGSLSPPMEGLEAAYSGNLYSLSAGASPSLYIVNRNSGAATLIGALGISVSGAAFGGLAMRGIGSNEMYGVVSSATGSQLYGIRTNGVAVLRGSMGFPGVSGLAFHVRRPGPLIVRRVGSIIEVSWPYTNGGYLWRRTSVNGPASWTFESTFPATNRFEMFFLSPYPPF